jgi:6-phosphogluconolactonase
MVGGLALYSAVGDVLVHYDVDVENAALVRRGSLKLSSAVQYVWPHPSLPFLYAATSDATYGRMPTDGELHSLCALRIEEGGTLELHGEPQALPRRSIHHSLDPSGKFALVCHNAPSGLSVYRIGPDGAVGEAVRQDADLDSGIFGHQVRVMPSGRSVVMVTRGVDSGAGGPERPGALKIYGWQAGHLSPLASLAVGGRGGVGYGPRHLDFHPTQPLAFVSVERQNRLHVHRLQGDSLEVEPRFNVTTITREAEVFPGQMAGAIHVHPRGHAVYVSNRASDTVDSEGGQVFAGGENSIAVFAVDPDTGAPTALQHIDTQGFHVRSFTIDPSGRLLVAASLLDMLVREDGELRRVPAGLSLFRIADDGRLTFVRKYGVETAEDRLHFWVGIVPLPSARAG